MNTVSKCTVWVQKTVSDFCTSMLVCILLSCCCVRFDLAIWGVFVHFLVRFGCLAFVITLINTSLSARNRFQTSGESLNFFEQCRNLKLLNPTPHCRRQHTTSLFPLTFLPIPCQEKSPLVIVLNSSYCLVVWIHPSLWYFLKMLWFITAHIFVNCGFPITAWVACLLSAVLDYNTEHVLLYIVNTVLPILLMLLDALWGLCPVALTRLLFFKTWSVMLYYWKCF